MLEGELDPELGKRWAWDRDNGPAPYGDMWPRRELSDLQTESGRKVSGGLSSVL